MPVSAKAIQKNFRDVGPAQAQGLSAVIRDVEQSYSNKRASYAMDLANEVLEGFGVEAIRGDWVDGYYGDIVATYVNTGDTYNATILFDTDKRRFYLTTWGDWVEKHGEKRGVM